MVILKKLNIGDVYFTSCAFTYAEKAKRRKYIIIAPENFPMQVFIRWQNANGAEIEQVYITMMEWEYLRDYPNKEKYQGVLDFYTRHYEGRLLLQSTSKLDVYENLTRPKFPVFDMQKYIREYGVITGKTVFVIPNSNFSGTLPLYFWTMSIN